MSLPHTSVLVLPLFCTQVFPLIFTLIFLSHNTPDTVRHSLPVLPPALHSLGDFRIQFSILHQRRSQVCECLNSLYCLSLWMDLLNYSSSLLSTNLQSPLFHCSSPFLKLPFYMVSSGTAQHCIVCKQHTPVGCSLMPRPITSRIMSNR